MPGLLILCMNSYLIYKIIKSQKSRPKYLGFQQLHPKKESIEKYFVKTESKKLSLCSLEAMNEMNRSSTPSLFSKKSIIKAKNTIMPKTFCDYFKYTNKRPKKTLSKYSSSTQTKSSIIERGAKQQNERLYNSNSGSNRHERFVASRKTCSLTSESVNPCSSKSRPLRHRLIYSTNKTLIENEKKIQRISVNRISHYVTIIVLGFYFILSTIPYAVMLSLQNNATLKLNYFLDPNEIYKDKLWLRYGLYRDLVALTKLFFISNHCLNFFVYLLFNRIFRHVFISSIFSIFSFFKFLNVKIEKNIFHNNNKNNRMEYRHCSSKKAKLDKNYN